MPYRYWSERDDATGGRYYRDCATFDEAAEEADYWQRPRYPDVTPPDRFGIDEIPQMELDGYHWGWTDSPW